MANTTTMTNDKAAREIAKLTARLARQGRKDLADAIIAAVHPALKVGA